MSVAAIVKSLHHSFEAPGCYLTAGKKKEGNQCTIQNTNGSVKPPWRLSWQVSRSAYRRRLRGPAPPVRQWPTSIPRCAPRALPPTARRTSGAVGRRQRWSLGRGRAELTDPDGEKFTHQFAITAVVDRDGTARGKATFVFSDRFSQKWGAVPGVDLIHLEGDLKTGSVDQTGQASLGGTFIETDYSRTEGIVYQEDSSVSGAAPLAIVISPDSRKFTLAWCGFIPGSGYFSAEVTEGHLKVHQASDR